MRSRLLSLRLASRACAVLLLGGCAAPAAVTVALPPDVHVVPPGADVPRPTADFSGIWAGVWGATQEAIGGEKILVSTAAQLSALLAVERIEARRAAIVYAWGTSPEWGIDRPGSVRATARIEGGLLRARLDNGGEVEFKLAGDRQTLSGKYTFQGRSTFGVFTRQPQ